MHILLVDPVETAFRCMAEAIRARGHQVEGAQTVTIALRLVQERAFDGVVVASLQADVPGELFGALQPAQKGARIPTCVLSPSPHAEQEQVVARFLETLAGPGTGDA